MNKIMIEQDGRHWERRHYRVQDDAALALIEALISYLGKPAHSWELEQEANDEA